MTVKHWLSVFVLCVTSSTCVWAQDNAPVVNIAGETISDNELTSFAMQLELTEGRRFGTKEELLNELILTKLSDKVPTSATISVDAEQVSSPSPYAYPAQRVLIRKEFQKWLADNLDVPRAEMETWYEENKQRYTKPERVHAYHLFMETTDDEASTASETNQSQSEDNNSSSPEKVRAKLNKLKAEIDSGTSFSLLAEKYSEAASGQAGGEIGQITRRMPIGPLSKPMNLKLEEAFFSLPPMKVSEVIDTKHGMHLLYVTEKVTTQTPALDDLITSGILPGALARDRLTSEVRSRIEKAEKDHKGVLLPGKEEDVTTDTVAFQLNGKDYTVGSLIAVFGPRFSGYLNSVKSEPEELRELMKQAMDDEALLYAAIDEGIVARPDIASQLKEIAKRDLAAKRIDAIANAEAKVTDADLQARYELIKEELRQPEAAGQLIKVNSEESSGTAEQARAREEAHKKAEDIRKRLETENVADVLKSLATDKLISVTSVTLHTIGSTTNTEDRLFDQTISGITGTRGLSQVVPAGPDFLLAVMEKRLPGEPLALEKVEPRLKAMVEQEKQAEVRREMVKRLEAIADIKYLEGASKYGKGKADDAEPIGAPND